MISPPICCTINETILRHSDQIVAAREHDLIAEYLESLLTQHVIERQRPGPVDRSI